MNEITTSRNIRYEYPYNAVLSALTFRGIIPQNEFSNTKECTEKDFIKFLGVEKLPEYYVESVLFAISTLYRPDIFEYRYRDAMTLEQISKKVDLCTERVRQILTKCNRQLASRERYEMITKGIPRILKEKDLYIHSMERELCYFKHKEEQPKLLYDLTLSVRSYNALARYGIKNVNEIKGIIDSGEIYKIRNLGPKSIKEISDAIGYPLPEVQ